MFRVGIGYDAHQLVKGRKLMLGGVHIPYHKGLKGHSDADVIIHAVCDALLGASALGDIGRHFPNTDPAFHDIASLALLLKTRKLIEREGYRVVNIDAVLVAEEPKIAPYIDAMKKNIADILQMILGSVSIKATTNEKMGFAGRKEGMGVVAVTLLEKT